MATSAQSRKSKAAAVPTEPDAVAGADSPAAKRPVRRTASKEGAPRPRTRKPKISTEPPPPDAVCPAPAEPVAARIPRVLVVHPDMATARLLSESLEARCHCRVERTTSGLTGYELALQRDFDLFLFNVPLPILPGPLLFDLLDTAYRFSRGRRFLPRVLYFCEASEVGRHDELLRDIRVLGLLATPVKIPRLLEKVKGVLPPRPETEAPEQP